ncbi:MAG: ankyrin repeat domain-containing protein, partial [Cyanobacteria bacterium]|nr:ankyrin repeat domain-containing protein [Cyanobacteria bacterium CG_2015-16_32_12]
LAIVNGWQKIAMDLIQAGANPNTRLLDGKTILMKVCDQNNKELISKLLKAGADVNLEDKGGGTALMWASHRGYLEAVKLLLEVKNINIHHHNHGNYTAASLAEYNHHPEVAKFLKDWEVK